MTKEKVVLLTVENVAIWSGVGLALNIALPLIQIIAGLCAAIYSVLSIIKMLKHWNETVKK
jgi:hypothetical protein